MPTKKSINRRQFLSKAAGIAVGTISFPYVVPSSVLGKGGSVAPSNRIVMGCIGLGGQGTHNMKMFMRSPEVQMVAVCDVEAQSSNYHGGSTAGREPARMIVEGHYAKQKPAGAYKGCDSYNDFRELLASDNIDAVTVCTPDHWHGYLL